MRKWRKSCAFNCKCESPHPGFVSGFDNPFERELDPSNSWVVLSRLIPWDDLCNVYLKQTGRLGQGHEPLDPKIVLGSLIIKNICNLEDRETIYQISGNIYIQYFLVIRFLSTISLLMLLCFLRYLSFWVWKL